MQQRDSKYFESELNFLEHSHVAYQIKGNGA